MKTKMGEYIKYYNQKINFRDFILYIDKVMNGDEDEKA